MDHAAIGVLRPPCIEFAHTYGNTGSNMSLDGEITSE